LLHRLDGPGDVLGLPPPGVRPLGAMNLLIERIRRDAKLRAEAEVEDRWASQR